MAHDVTMACNPFLAGTERFVHRARSWRCAPVFSFCQGCEPRMLPAGEKSVGLESDPYRGSPIRLRRGRQQGSGPLLVLKKCGDIKISGHPQICFYEFVVEFHAAGDKVSINLLVPVSELQAALRTEPIIHPRLLARSFASDPTA